MNLNPNDWSCLPTSFANVLRMDLGEFMQRIGHDGSDIVPEWGERRGFHTQECIEVCETMGVRCVMIDLFPLAAPGPDSPPVAVYMGAPKLRLERHMGDSEGVLLGTVKKDTRLVGHAAAWYDDTIIDPRGGGLCWDASNFLYKFFDPRQYIKVYR